MFGNWVADLRMVMDLLRHVTVHRIKLGCQTKRLQKDLQRPWTRHHSQGHAFLLSYGKVLRVAEGWICLICGTSWYYHFAQGLYIYIYVDPFHFPSRHPLVTYRVTQNQPRLWSWNAAAGSGQSVICGNVRWRGRRRNAWICA